MSDTPWRVCPEHGEYKRFGDGGCLKCGMVGMRVDEGERVRSAAPDLLEALEEFVAADECERTADNRKNAAIDRARAVIAKARGVKT